jgi:hypothetical protein
MRTIIATLENIGCYSQSKHYETPKLDKEGANDYEERTWRERMHVDSKGWVFIPAMAFKNCLAEAAKFISMQIPGKGKATYTKHFEAGVMVMDDLVLPIKKEDVECDRLFVPADGVRGSGKRVKKNFPVIREWKGDVTFYILDDTITAEVFKKHLEEAGKFIGIGRFRPRNNGNYGRFRVLKVREMEADF